MSTFFAEWKAYRQQVLPADASEVQVTECRRAFYAGASAFLFLTSKLMSDGDAITDADMDAIMKVHSELAEFANRGGL